MTATCVVKEQRMDKPMLDELIYHASEAMYVIHVPLFAPN